MKLKSVVRKRVLNPIQDNLRQRARRNLAKQIRNGGPISDSQIRRFRRAWGNEAWSADETYLATAARLAHDSHGPILECGSGLTTFLLGLLAERSNIQVISLEQDEEWWNFVKSRLREHSIETVKVLYAPLRRFGDYVWYDVNRVEMNGIEAYGVVLVDGPAVLESQGDAYASWRYGVMPQLQKMGVTFGTAVLDDATEPRAANLLRRWKDEYDLEIDLVRSEYGDLAICRKPASTL